jgi:hypothetical protein
MEESHVIARLETGVLVGLGKHHCLSEPPPHLAIAAALVAGGLLSLIPEQTCIHEKGVKGLGA